MTLQLDALQYFILVVSMFAVLGLFGMIGASFR